MPRRAAARGRFFDQYARVDPRRRRDVEPGKAADSHLIELVMSDDKDERMPKDKPPLSAADDKNAARVDRCGHAVGGGLHIRGSRLRAAAAAATAGASAGCRWAETNPVDRILDAYLAEAQSCAAGAARRCGVSAARVSGYRRPAAHAGDAARVSSRATIRRSGSKSIDELLANNHAYAEHWLSFWNDLLRNDYAGTGYIDGGRKQISAWLYRALVENKPYDQFVRELIAPSPESEGFIAASSGAAT